MDVPVGFNDDNSAVVFKSLRVVLPEGLTRPASIATANGKIRAVGSYDATNSELGITNDCQPVTVIDCGDLVISPGLVDSHVHVNEPGRTHWEGFETATRAAAAGGVTCIVDMPLNSIPPTTTRDNFAAKVEAAKDHVHVDVAFWGGIIPRNQDELIPLLAAGVRGFKCFMCPSGVDEFPNVTTEDLEIAFQSLAGSKGTILFHAEVGGCTSSGQDDPKDFATFLETRPGSMEVEAIRQVVQLCGRYKVPCHIVHLSSSEAIPIIDQAVKDGLPITVETCPHYLTLLAEQVPSGCTQFKCCPPIRNKDNQDRLWQGILDGVIQLVVSDHSPAPADLKCLETGDFIQAWGGIASLQLVLPLLWTYGGPKGLTLDDLARLLSRNTARLARLDHRKGSIAPGMDADLCVWDPEDIVTVTEDMLQFRHKLSPYLGQLLKGRVKATVLRGRVVYSDGSFAPKSSGILLTDPLL